MTYELAKELKNAGFPQDKGLIKAEESKQTYGWFTCEGRGDAYIDGELVEGFGAFREELWQPYDLYQEAIYAPTLSELIESCGGWFHELVKRDDETWYAGTKLDDNRPRYGTGSGSTPEVAVARLWLALNPRKKKLTTNRDI